jgi:hypothetical protein
MAHLTAPQTPENTRNGASGALISTVNTHSPYKGRGKRCGAGN